MKRLLLVVVATIGCGVVVVATIGCGEAEVQIVRITLRSPQALDPAQVASVGIAVIHEPAESCVTGIGSNQCATIQTVEAATKSAGYVKQVSLTPSTGSTTFLEALPFGRTCFVAEALSANLTSLASGCAEVSLMLEKQKLEIELQAK